MDEEKKVSETTEQTPKKRGGRKPMSPEEKAAAAKGYPAQGQQQNTVQGTARGRKPIYLRLPPSCTINHDI